MEKVMLKTDCEFSDYLPRIFLTILFSSWVPALPYYDDLGLFSVVLVEGGSLCNEMLLFLVWHDNGWPGTWLLWFINQHNNFPKPSGRYLMSETLTFAPELHAETICKPS